MGHLLAGRRRQILQKGRGITLTRFQGPSLTLTAFPRAFKPDELVEGVKVGDLMVHTLADEMAAASWPVPPRQMDRMMIDGATYIVQAAWPVHEGPTVIGWRIWVRGG